MTASPDAPHALVYKDGRFYVRAERIIEPSPTPPEHHADSAYCSDAQVGLPSEEVIARAICCPDGCDGDTGSGRPCDIRREDRTSMMQARAALDLIRPAFEAKEREIAETDAEITLTESLLADERAARFAAEAKLAQAVEALEPFASYHEAAEFLDDKGHPLPDDQHAGYVYLTMGAFRRAAAAMGEKT